MYPPKQRKHDYNTSYVSCSLKDNKHINTPTSFAGIRFFNFVTQRNNTVWSNELHMHASSVSSWWSVQEGICLTKRQWGEKKWRDSHYQKINTKYLKITMFPMPSSVHVFRCFKQYFCEEKICAASSRMLTYYSLARVFVFFIEANR